MHADYNTLSFYIFAQIFSEVDISQKYNNFAFELQTHEINSDNNCNSESGDVY